MIEMMNRPRSLIDALDSWQQISGKRDQLLTEVNAAIDAVSAEAHRLQADFDTARANFQAELDAKRKELAAVEQAAAESAPTPDALRKAQAQIMQLTSAISAAEKLLQTFPATVSQKHMPAGPMQRLQAASMALDNISANFSEARATLRDELETYARQVAQAQEELANTGLYDNATMYRLERITKQLSDKESCARPTADTQAARQLQRGNIEWKSN